MLTSQIFVGERGVVDRRDERGFHVLPAFEAVERAVGLEADAADFWIEFAEAARGADECAAGAKAGDEVRDASFGLIPDFVGGAVIVGLPVRGIAVLVGIEIFLRIGGDDFVDFANGAVGGFVAGSHDEFGAERGEDALAFVRGAVGQASFTG